MRNFLMVLLVLGFLVSCDKGIVTSEYRAIDENSWSKDSIVEFAFSDTDTIQKHDIFINIRNDESYPYNNLFLIAELAYPTGDIVTDTLEYEMAQPDGKWLGKGRGSIKENKLWYKENIVFPRSGVYSVRISHAMRKNGNVDGVANLEGVTDVGFEVVKSNK